MADPELRPALFLDLDGTVRETTTGRVHPMYPWDQVLKPGVAERIAEYRALGYLVVGVTNQGGVGLGYLKERDVEKINRHLMDELAPGLFDLILFSPYHPKGKNPRRAATESWRKPNPGMAFEARDRLDIDLGRSVMVGDMTTDRQFAKNAGIPEFHWASDFFGPRVALGTVEQQ